MIESTVHVPVLLREVLNALRPASGGTYLDGTLGGGGHTAAMAQLVNADPQQRGLVIALDRDPAAVARAEEQLAGLPVAVGESNYADAPEILQELKLDRDGKLDVLDGILLDLGLSSDQLADENRGFSFHATGPLDLRFDPTRGEPAWRLVNFLRQEVLADIIYEYGEERFSRRIARVLAEERRKRTLESAAEIAQVVERAVPAAQRHGRIHAATRTFQALRIAVNEELKWLQVALRRLPELLKPGGRIAIISFHSLEDRLVKQAYRDNTQLDVITRSPIRASAEEQETNPRSRSAKLRVAQRRAPAE